MFSRERSKNAARFMRRLAEISICLAAEDLVMQRDSGIGEEREKQLKSRYLLKLVHKITLLHKFCYRYQLVILQASQQILKESFKSLPWVGLMLTIVAPCLKIKINL